MAELYTPSQVLSIVGSIGVLITAIGAVIVNIIVALRTGKKVDAVQAQADNISHQVQEVHTITNSNLSAVKAELKTAVAQISEMRVLVADLKNERDKLATVVAYKTVPRSTDARTRLSDNLEVTDALKSIDENTGTTADNTAQLVKEPKKGK